MATEPRIIGQTASPSDPVTEAADLPEAPTDAATREIGGRDGPEPTRYGDWEKNGRCIDF
jgi:hypothetical protein